MKTLFLSIALHNHVLSCFYSIDVTLTGHLNMHVCILVLVLSN